MTHIMIINSIAHWYGMILAVWENSKCVQSSSMNS